MKPTLLILLGVAVVVLAAVLIWQMMRDPPAPPSRSAVFRMTVDDAFALKEQGSVVVVGVVSEGEVRPGDVLSVQTAHAQLRVVVKALEAFHKPVKRGKAGDRIGIMLTGANKEQISSGDLLVSAE